MTAAKKSFKFHVIGDYGRDGKHGQKAVARAMSKHTVDMIIGTGDNLYESGAKSPTSKRWKRSIEDIYFKYDNLRLPWYNILGNRDYKHDPQNELDYQNPYWKLPQRYYTVEKDDIQFVFLDTNQFNTYARNHPKKKAYRVIIATNPKEQLEWFKGVMERSTAKWKIVIGHHHVISSGSHNYGPRTFMEETFEELFEKYEVDIYFCGHEHILEHLKKPSGHTNYFISGAGSKVSSLSKKNEHSQFARGKTHGFLSVEISGNRCSVSIIDKNGLKLYNKFIFRH